MEEADAEEGCLLDVVEGFGQEKLLHFVVFVPNCKESCLSIVSFVCKEHLRSDIDNLSVQTQYSAVEHRVLEEHRHANVADDPVSHVTFKNLCQDLPRMKDCVWL